MNSRLHRTRAPRAGAAAIEFALTVPFLLMMTFGVVDFTRYLDAWNTAESVARDGCRYGATITKNDDGTPADQKKIEDTTDLQTQAILDLTKYDCTKGCIIDAALDDENPILGNTLTVVVTLPFTSLFGVVDLQPVSGVFEMRTMAQGIVVP